MGIVWERMIKTTKNCLFKTLDSAKSDYFQLLTMISDIQRAINSRLLTYCSTSDTEVLPSTPNAFYSQILMGTFPRKRILADVLTWNLLPGLNYQMLSPKRKNCYIVSKKYLLGLRESFKNQHDMDFNTKTQVNDVVLVKNPAKTRLFWKLVRITEVFQGNDGNIHSARITRGDASYENHNIQRLFPMELSLTHNVKRCLML